ncbi:hypothetical protein DL764_000147 [Monosporascus ibericus]|uniref:Transcription factor domain-containing protein n=1 Tax=Monosporascus ibericus TaxID=155417 RepID=A0A4V1XCY1_9PEZI|nr:hypothetical protein DL764_000147 [Monosporascus ibericus]
MTGMALQFINQRSGYSKPRQLLWNDLCLTSFPQQLDPESTKLMHRWFFDISDVLFPPQFCSKFDMVKSIWVNCVLADEASSYVDFFERKPGISSKALYHISKAYGLVNLKLSGPESVSDNAIAAVVTLAIYQQIHQQHSTGLIHLNGLYRMIQLRGGIARLMKENRALALKPLRLDVELALQNGSPLFRSDAVPVNAVSGDSRTTKEQPRSTAPWFSHIMLDVLNFASLLNGREREGRTKLDPLNYTETLLSLLYRLIDVAPLGQPRSMSGGLYDDVAHLAMLAFMTTLLPEYGRDRSSYLLLSNRLESTIQDFHVTSADTPDSGLSLLLWTLFISGVSVLKREDHWWLSFFILETCERLDLYDWPAVRRQLCEFPWVYTLHDVPGRYLWEDAQRRSPEIA